MHRLVGLILLAVAVGISTSCIRSAGSLERLIANQGPLAVSNKYDDVTANAYLLEERKECANLDSFLQKHDLPHVIDLSTSGSFPELRLYYIDKNELYRLVKREATWFIAGEEPIPPVIKEQLANTLSAPAKSEETFAAAQNTSFPEKQRQEDYLHQVTNSTETLGAIVGWYTGDEANAEAIARINSLSGITRTTPLAVDTKVLIPSYLLKTRVPYQPIPVE